MNSETALHREMRCRMQRRNSRVPAGAENAGREQRQRETQKSQAVHLQKTDEQNVGNFPGGRECGEM
jgi:hypothetical protein